MKRNIVFVSATDNYPVKFTATNSKNELISRGLLLNDSQITIINSPLGMKNIPPDKQHGMTRGIEYHLFTPGKKNILGNIRKIRKLLKEKKLEQGENVMVLEHSYYPLFLTYIAIARRLKYKVVVILTEWHLYFENIKRIKQLDFFLFDHTFGYLVDGILPISEMLVQKVSHFKKPILKVPILADFEELKPIHYELQHNGEEYFMYCSNMGYYPVIEFTIRSYGLFLKQSSQQPKLRLVLSGPESDFDRLRQFIREQGLESQVQIDQKLPFATLMKGYQHALALLIPMRPENQDKARFSHKIGEYLSSGRPIITGNIGEISHYFTHQENAFIAEKYTIEEYASLMQYVAENREQAGQVGLQGRHLGETTFDFALYGKKIASYLDNLN